MITIDGDRLVVSEPGRPPVEHALGSPEAFKVLSGLWLRAGWDTKYVYSFSWLGRPIIQLPEDMVRIQEVVYQLKPDVILETGIAHGGSLVFYAGLQRAMGRGRVIGVDVEIRPHNRRAIEAHELFSSITLVEGSSIDPAIVARVKDLIAPGETVLLMLDSAHNRDHVLAELEAYAPLVSAGSYAVVADGIMREVALSGAPRTKEDWSWNNPLSAMKIFLERHPEFEQVEPPFPFNEGAVRERVTYWPDGFLRRKST
jgi:cephalosporin hydroxylase